MKILCKFLGHKMHPFKTNTGYAEAFCERCAYVTLKKCNNDNQRGREMKITTTMDWKNKKWVDGFLWGASLSTLALVAIMVLT